MLLSFPITYCLLKTEHFGDLIVSASSGKSLLSWAQTIELVPISETFCLNEEQDDE
jgi:hypothetical protein